MATCKNRFEFTDNQFVNAWLPKGDHVNNVRAILEQNKRPYARLRDYNQPFRQALVHTCRRRLPFSSLDSVIRSQLKATKRDDYSRLKRNCERLASDCGGIVGYIPEPSSWNAGELRVKVRPQIGLFVNNVPMAIKLCISKKRALERADASLLYHLMYDSNRDLIRENFAVWDLYAGQAFYFDGCHPDELVHLRSLSHCLRNTCHEIHVGG